MPFSSKSSQQKLKKFGAKVSCKEKLSYIIIKIHTGKIYTKSKHQPLFLHKAIVKKNFEKKTFYLYSFHILSITGIISGRAEIPKVSPKFTGFGTSWFWWSCCIHATSHWSVWVSILISDILRAVQRERTQNDKGQHRDWRNFSRRIMEHKEITLCQTCTTELNTSAAWSCRQQSC